MLPSTLTQDEDFLRLRVSSVSYRLPRQLLRRLAPTSLLVLLNDLSLTKAERSDENDNLIFNFHRLPPGVFYDKQTQEFFVPRSPSVFDLIVLMLNEEPMHVPRGKMGFVYYSLSMKHHDQEVSDRKTWTSWFNCYLFRLYFKRCFFLTVFTKNHTTTLVIFLQIFVPVCWVKNWNSGACPRSDSSRAVIRRVAIRVLEVWNCTRVRFTCTLRKNPWMVPILATVITTVTIVMAMNSSWIFVRKFVPCLRVKMRIEWVIVLL